MSDKNSKQRIAKFISRAGGPSRRKSEELISNGLIKVNNETISNPATFVDSKDIIEIDGKILNKKEPTKLWILYKPTGYITTEKDPEGRKTIYDLLPKGTKRLLTVGRLDINSEGLLLMTNDGEFKRKLELPSNGIARQYRVRVFGKVKQYMLDKLSEGIVIDRIHYAPIHASIDKVQGSNAWLSVILTEGKNREIRKVMSHLGLEVNRLIRTDYGPFSLGDQPIGTLKDVSQIDLKKLDVA